MLVAPLQSMFSREKLVGLFAVENRDDLALLGELLSSGAITTAIDCTYQLEGVPDALRHLGDGGAAGKVFILPDDAPAGIRRQRRRLERVQQRG